MKSGYSLAVDLVPSSTKFLWVVTAEAIVVVVVGIVVVVDGAVVVVSAIDVGDTGDTGVAVGGKLVGSDGTDVVISAEFTLVCAGTTGSCNASGSNVCNLVMDMFVALVAESCMLELLIAN